MRAEWSAVMPAAWLMLSALAACIVMFDIWVAGHKQPMPIMSVVWPLTVLYWGPAGLIFYFWFGRSNPGAGKQKAPMWQSTFLGATHCGAGCALGDFIGEWLAFALSLAIAGSELAGRLALAFALAYLIGIAFQYFSIAPMRGLGLRDGIVAAVKADTLSLLAYEVGMFACMIAFAKLASPLKPTDAAYWVRMQAAMVVGFATTCPVNYWLIRRGIKEKM
ncbi:DUF4396 domain-containing protein [bacterium M00.F.Ca.ET.228.01.1.1]|nr:DUF4396 domain-containing protein [Paraburkholderia phenoliruptrix]MBW9096332.1 DUF4396 domain-containing protein [Paraburkholderia phenoliruptrix]TGP47644.1 DUF4396 domain-containing protein [bacterium M00.F.Ca.ET.228.01.1.1]TGS05437.1 DUF4396 domain-containing protein [bacterium M00.F.Ca.ET.191.01.1.1]TGU10373.1 DUF4396 domain-containing protein [bacterium M00.F.Ca.ET.155.01.1.1]